MKNLIFSLIILLFLTDLTAQAQNRKIKFETLTFAQALEKAKAEKKYIFMDAFTTWCGPCKMLDKQVFTNDSIADFYNQHFVNLKMDMEKGEGIELREKYGVEAFPTLLFIEANAANIAYKLIGYMPASKLLLEGQRMIDPQKNPDVVKQRYEQNKQDFKYVKDYLEVLQNTYAPNVEVIDEYWSKIPDNQKLKAENFDLIKQFLSSKNSQAFQEILKKRADYEKNFSKDSVDKLIENVYQLEIYNGEGSQSPDAFKKMVAEFLTLDTKNKKRLEVSYQINVLMMEGRNDEMPQYINDYVQANLLNNNEPQTKELADDLLHYAWLVQLRSTNNQFLTNTVDWLIKAEKIYSNPLFIERKAIILKQLGKNQEALTNANQALELFNKSDEQKPSPILLYIIDELKSKPEVVGYKIKKDKITFIFNSSEYQYLIDGESGELSRLDTIKIDRVFLAGNFNDWNPNDENFALAKDAKGQYQLTKKLKEINQNQPVEFKFVVNNNQWVTPAAKARNKKGANPDEMVNNGNMLIEQKIK